MNLEKEQSLLYVLLLSVLYVVAHVNHYLRTCTRIHWLKYERVASPLELIV